MDIKKRVKDIIKDKLGIDESEITDEKNFIDDLRADSLDTVELIMAFEEEFGITIPDSDYEEIQTVGQAIDYIKSAISQSVDQKIKKIISKVSSIDEGKIDINALLEEDLGIVDEINHVFKIILPEIDSADLTANRLAKEVVNQLLS